MALPKRPEIFLTNLALDIAAKAREYVRPRIDSNVMRRTLRLVPLRPSVKRFGAAVEVPHYWAVAYHDGRKAVRPRNKKFLVFWLRGKKQLDPRVQAGAWYPRRLSEVKRLTRAQFYKAVKAGEVVVTKKAGPAGPHPFFTIGMRSFEPIADKMVRTAVEAWITQDADLGPRAMRRETAKGAIVF